MRDILNVSLQDLLTHGYEGRVQELFSTFTCEKDSDIESFLRDRAIEFERIAKSRTYFIIDLKSIERKTIHILGYFALSLKALVLPEDMSIRGRRELDGFSGKINGKPVREIPTYLIGQLARNSSISNADLSGKALLETALSVIANAKNAVGGRFAMIECHNEPNLLRFYEENGFQHIMNEPDGDIPMVQMIRRL